MQLIKKIEVNYLRSLYRLEISEAGDLNVVFGRNDSGKSNLLRSLNLFFNGKSEPFREFNFNLDMSDIRKFEAREVKGKQFIWIKITFNTPANYIQSLGKEIEIKRQWNRDGVMTQNVWPRGLSDPKKAPRLTRFLNDIDFTYIPAIKDISLYGDLVERLYIAAAQGESITDATSQFVSEIGKGTITLTKNLAKLFDSESSLSAPTELSQLFRSLDFSYGTEKHSLLRQKGDGIKARHIPELLRFINENERRSKFYLWGFEEPENSLDLHSALLEATRFAELSLRDDTQIFLTSHSPAFYLSEANQQGIKRFFVSKQEKTDKGIRPANAAKVIDTMENAETAMESAGLLQLPYIIQKLHDMPKKLLQLEEQKSQLESQLREMDVPTIFVEGIHDLPIISSRFGQDAEVKLKTLKGTPSSVPALMTALENEGRLELGSKALIIFDNDPPGRGAMSKLLKNPPIDFASPYSVAGQLSVMCLPFNHCEDFRLFKAEVGLEEKELIFEGEFLLDPHLVAKTLVEKGFDGKLVHEDYYKKPQEKYQRMLSYEPGSTGWLFSRTVPNHLKGDVIEACIGNGNAPALDALEAIIREFLVQ